MIEVVTLFTQDNVPIVGDYYPAQSARGALLLHMMPADRKSWTGLAEKLQKKDFHVLAIDLRGHGESQGGPDGYKKFSDAEHQASMHDVDAGVSFLRSKGVGDLFLAGASIGANLSLVYCAAHSDVRAAVLLSPGLDFRGVATAEPMGRLGSDQRIYGVASKDDAYSRETVEKLFAGRESSSRRKNVFETGGHGTALFTTHPDLMDDIVLWFTG